MKKNIKKIISLVLAISITLASTVIYAANFKDISGHWAKKYIEKGQKLGLVSGVSAETYEPEAYLTRVEALIMVSRLLSPSLDEVEKAVKKYESTLLKYDLKDWTKSGISVALSYGIIDESILSNLINSVGIQTPSSREEVAKFVTCAIGLEKEAKSKPGNISLNYKDETSITKSAKPYILIMNEKKIMNGAKDRNFNPLAPIKRGEMASVLSGAYDYLQSTITEL